MPSGCSAERRKTPWWRGGCNEYSSARRTFGLVLKLPGVGLDGRSKILNGRKRRRNVTFLHFCRCPVQPGVDGAALGGSVLVVRGRELGAVNDGLRCDNDPAALESGYNEITIGDAGQGAQSGGQRHLALAVDLDDSGHIVKEVNGRSRTFPASCQ